MDLMPVFDLMTDHFEDQIEAFIENNSSFTMRELQAFYKLRTKVLHQRIIELNRLVESQNDDLQGTKS